MVVAVPPSPALDDETREAWEKLRGDEATAFVRKLRQEERRHRQEWALAARFWKELEAKQTLPARPADFPRDVQDYVAEYLRPMLTKPEK